MEENSKINQFHPPNKLASLRLEMLSVISVFGGGGFRFGSFGRFGSGRSGAGGGLNRDGVVEGCGVPGTDSTHGATH